MSDYKCYAGPVVRCKISYEKAFIEGCANQSCSAYGNRGGGKFCNQCAQPYGQVESKHYREIVNSSAVLSEEAMFSERVGVDRIFMPNVNRNGPRKNMFFDPSDEVQEVVSSIPAEMGWLHEAFAEEIAKLNDAYGSANVTVEWMVVSWYS